ncbi:CHC2 zinc finger domain-containing protein [Pseudomarimonas arenosa]|uniref:Toprim domain-containing protein n=1 Tax=Pseudomarimonas arenosa TaxID=2774145 RepID=A0AAW3ZPZ2_9GAMM|nr:CHC2 zinc finger domain-containing protein [Pseudomarimonas arenosa]MBD8528181.1 toprim domain-containing protein [Pseudomarimonas arenosa]
MARIPDSELERLKASVSLQRLVEAAGVTLKRHGKEWIGHCPFHEDRTPSLVISPKANLWHCLGACQAGGSVVDWVMRFEGVSFRRAVELLRQDLGEVAAEPVKPLAQEDSHLAARSAPALEAGNDAALLGQVLDYYHATLKQSPEALAYLQSRGLDHPELIDTFRLGYANRTLGYHLPIKATKAGAELRGALQRIGVLRESGHEHFNGSLVVPVISPEGTIGEVYGRKVTRDSKLRAGTPLHLYLPGPHRGVFNEAGLVRQEEVILCEALLDALTFWCAGYRNVTSAYGIEGFTDEILAAFQRHGIRRVLIAYDADEAGNAATEKLAAKLMAEGFECYRCRFPKGSDANQYALEVQPASKALGLVIRQAEWLGKGAAPTRSEVKPVPVAQPQAAPVNEAGSDSPLRRGSAQVLVADVSTDPVVSPTETAIATDPEPPAYRVPPSEPALPIEIDDKELRLLLGDRAYTVRGIEKNLSYEQLKVWLRVSAGDHVHVDTLELYAAKQRTVWLKQAAIELGASDDVLRGDLGKLLRAVEQRQDALIKAKLAPTQEAAAPVLNAEQESAALTLLRDPALVERIVRDVAAMGVVGEDANALVGYLACVSRKLDKPLAILIQSTSAAGKSTLMDGILALMPEAERVHYSAMTGQSLFYLGEQAMKHKILAIAEEEGVRQAAYALKLLQSQGELTIASTGKDPVSGQLVTQEYRVEGPVMLFLTTTAIDLDEELLNRCLVLTINESREQTEAIHRRQRQARTLAGLVASKEGAALKALHQAAQSLLRPLAVVNPYAEALTFRSESTRMRRDHAKYLTLIDAIAFLHQYQRPVKSTSVAGERVAYVEVTLDDIALANRLAHEVLGRSLDELPPQTRRVLGVVVAHVASEAQRQAVERPVVRFTRKDVRALCGITDTALRLHLDRLVDLDYLIVHRGGFGSRFVYELAFDGESDSPTTHLVGLIDVEALSVGKTSHPRRASSQGRGANLAPTSHPENTPVAPTSQGGLLPLSASTGADIPFLAAAVEETARLEANAPRRHNGASHAATRN